MTFMASWLGSFSLVASCCKWDGLMEVRGGSELLMEGR
jgi:hypothetical protein